VDGEEQREYLRHQMMDACVSLVHDAAIPLQLDTTDTHVCAVLMGLCIGMFNAGVRAGCTQALAQLAQQGVDVQISMDGYLVSESAESSTPRRTAR
jgi:hypothetical protein